MARRTLIVMMFAIGICWVPDIKIATSSTPNGQAMSQPISQRSAFRYVIARNKVLESTRYPEGGISRLRGVDVLLDPKAFSEPNLRQLVALLSKRFPKPEDLMINIYTDLDDVSTPEEEDVPASGPLDLTATPNHAWAFYIRNSEGERLDYHTKKPNAEFRSVQFRDKP